MPVIESKIMINSKSFKKNQQDHAKLIDEVRTLEKKIADNSARSKDKFEKRGQLLPRDRLNKLLHTYFFLKNFLYRYQYL